MIEQQIQLSELDHEDLVGIAEELKASTAAGLTIGGSHYPVKDTKIITPSGMEGKLHFKTDRYVFMFDR